MWVVHSNSHSLKYFWASTVFVWRAGNTDMASLLKTLIGKPIQLHLPLREIFSSCSTAGCTLEKCPFSPSDFQNMFLAHEEMFIYSGVLVRDGANQWDFSASESAGDAEIKGESGTKSVVGSWGQWARGRGLNRDPSTEGSWTHWKLDAESQGPQDLIRSMGYLVEGVWWVGIHQLG